MSPQDARKAEQDMLNTVVANRQEPGIKALFKLLDLRVRKAQDRLMTCQMDEFLTVQSEARVLQKLLLELNQGLPEQRG